MITIQKTCANINHKTVCGQPPQQKLTTIEPNAINALKMFNFLSNSIQIAGEEGFGFSNIIQGWPLPVISGVTNHKSRIITTPVAPINKAIYRGYNPIYHW